MLYTQYDKLKSTGSLIWPTDIIRAMLLEAASTYVFDPDHSFVSDITANGGIEVAVASYARQDVPSRSVLEDIINDRMVYSAGNVVYGALEAGETVEGLVIYKQTGGDDLTPADDDVLYYTTNTIPLTVAAPANIGATVIYVAPLPDTLAIGDTITVGTATGTLTVAAARGDRSITIDALATAAVTEGDTGTANRAASNLPFVLDGNLVQVTLPADGLIWV